MKRLSCSVALAALALTACGTSGDSAKAGNEANAQAPAQANASGGQAGATQAVATLQNAQGAAAGSATAAASEGGIMVSLRVEGLPAGEHGVHVHTTGRCDAPGFESAGGHWNPTGAQHGLEEPAGQHAGDMPNLNVDQNGRGSLDYRLQGGSLEAMLDADGAAFVVHASADDQRTEPSGNSGGRIACGVFRAG